MNCLIFFVLCFVALAKAGDELSVDFKEKLLAKVQAAGMKCVEDEKANGEDIGQLMSRQVPTRKEGKCVIACFNQAFGGQGKDGKFTRDGTIKALEPFKKENESVYNKILKLYDDCIGSVKSADRCDAAAEMSGCANGLAEKIGVTTEMFM